MVTPKKPRLFLREHRKAAGLGAPAVAPKMGMERESLLRWERKPLRATVEQLNRFAEAVGRQPDELWRHPSEFTVKARLERLQEQMQELTETVKNTGT